MSLVGQAAPPKGPEFGGSSPIGLVVTLLLLVAVILLIRSMNKHLKKVPASFDADPPDTADPTGGQPGTGRPAGTTTPPPGAAAPREPTDRPPPPRG